MRRARLARPMRVARVAIPAGFLALFFAYPVAAIIRRGLVQDGNRNLTDIVTSASLGRVVWFTTWQAALSTLVTMAIGLPAAYVLGCRSFRGR